MSLRTLLTTLLLTFSFSVMAATEIVPLNNRTSADLLPVAQNFIGKDGKVSAYGNQLIVNAEPEKINELRAFLAQLDTAAKRLLITVDTNENNVQDSQGYSINGAPQARIISRSTESRDGGIQQIQASEGVRAKRTADHHPARCIWPPAEPDPVPQRHPGLLRHRQRHRRDRAPEYQHQS
jgi:hypothetical protein